MRGEEDDEGLTAIYIRSKVIEVRDKRGRKDEVRDETLDCCSR